ncbi:hypothetical protein CKO28_04645 [Rhodovibrio sodomensis]|uniref:ABC transporter ATP-binding protein n=1 Tax=Rhodovibrio sodomensis TaxID=1088 RepID=A0ABS1DBK1_9PROT|nr:DUF5131 family protein [Rhodovibrio sodomensis]MBK1667316.1 hypothetical protein [Rhodovibrio sodomensis]
MAKTRISWAERSWNPTVGCALVSAGCTNCYAMYRAQAILEQNTRASGLYEGLVRRVNGKPVWTGEVKVVESRLDAPFSWRDPTIAFVDSMSDLFYEKLPEARVFQILDVMRRASRHIFLVLTKRPLVMRDRLTAYRRARGISEPFENIAFGVSAEDQRSLDARLPILADIPAPVRFISAEPMIGPLSLDGLPSVEWLIVGGESLDREQRDRGELARVFDPDWARVLLRQCRARGIAFHFKQLGARPIGPGVRAPKGDAPAEFPDDLRVREMPEFAHAQSDLFSTPAA